MSRLTGKVAIVTGGASGIGRATALRLAEEGARVVVADLNGPGAETVAEEIQHAGGVAIGVKSDVSDEGEVEAMTAAAVAEFGSVDVLHNNAAMVGAGLLGLDGDVLSTSPDIWDRTFAVTLRGQWLCARSVMPHMLAAGRGSIINTSSGASLGGDRSRIAYSAAKAGVNSLTRSIATVYGKQGIRCNAIAPGFVLTPPARLQVPPRDLAVYVDNCLTPELGEPEDIAAVVAFLAADESRYITGQVISVDGGSFSHLGTLAAFRRLARDDADEASVGAGND